MEPTATHFNTQAAELLPMYRDAYLRGDLARLSAQAVENYLHRATSETSVVAAHGFGFAQGAGISAGAMSKQASRFRHRALSLMLAGVLVAGAATAANPLPIHHRALTSQPVALATAATTAQTVVLHGRVLNESGFPVAGAAVLDRGTNLGTSTDKDGNYTLRVPATGQATLQYSYGGYTYQQTKTLTASVAR